MIPSGLPVSEQSTELGTAGRNAWRVGKSRVDTVRRPRPLQVVSWPALPQDLVIDLSRTALVVVDMQNDFCHADGWLASIGVDIEPARRPIEPLRALLPGLRSRSVPIIWLNWGNRPDKANLPPSLLHVYNNDGASTGLGDPLARTGSPVLQAGAWSSQVVDELFIESVDIQVDKYRMSGFWDTPLDSILRNLDVTTLLFAGVNADQCVMTTLQDAACLGYDCVMLEDCCATTSPQFCVDATLYNVRQCFGFTALSTDLPRSAT